MLAIMGIGLGSTAAASPSETIGVTQSARDTVIHFEGRVVTIRRSADDRLAQASISRAVPGDLVALIDRSGREWAAVVPPGGSRAETPWVSDAVRARARTTQGKEIHVLL